MRLMTIAVAGVLMALEVCAGNSDTVAILHPTNYFPQDWRRCAIVTNHGIGQWVLADDAQHSLAKRNAQQYATRSAQLRHEAVGFGALGVGVCYAARHAYQAAVRTANPIAKWLGIGFGAAGLATTVHASIVAHGAWSNYVAGAWWSKVIRAMQSRTLPAGVTTGTGLDGLLGRWTGSDAQCSAYCACERYQAFSNSAERNGLLRRGEVQANDLMSSGNCPTRLTAMYSTLEQSQLPVSIFSSEVLPPDTHCTALRHNTGWRGWLSGLSDWRKGVRSTGSLPPDHIAPPTSVHTFHEVSQRQNPKNFHSGYDWL